MKYTMSAKMYIEENNGGKDILITDGEGKWYYIGAMSHYGDIDLYEEDEDGCDKPIEEIAKNLRNYIAEGADNVYDLLGEYGNEEYECIKYRGCLSIEEIDRICNYIDDMPSNVDVTRWIEI